MTTVIIAPTFGLPPMVRISDMPTAIKPYVIVVGHKETDDRQHLGTMVKLLVEGQGFNLSPIKRAYSAVLPSRGQKAWWDRLRDQTEDKQIHTLR